MSISAAAELVTIFDTTLRDGEQSPGCSMDAGEKLYMAGQLDRLGVDVLEAGFPVASDGDFLACQAIARKIWRPRIAALARTRAEDIRRAWQAIEDAEQPRLHIFLATSDIHLQYKLKISRAQALQQAREGVQLARSLCPDVEFSPEDATRSDFDFLCEMLETAIEAGATTINIPDTVGYTLPDEFGRLINRIKEKVSGAAGITISVHCHNDLGLAVANSLAGVQAGARQVECTINGIGERAGNAALEEVVMAMRVRKDQLPYQTNILSEQIYAASQALAGVVSFEAQPNKAIVGRNAFAHEAGIHQHGMMSNPLCYEIMSPESVGVESTKLVLGKHSGRHALLARYAELGHKLQGDDVDNTYARFTQLADKKKNIYDQDLLALLPVRRRKPQTVPQAAVSPRTPPTTPTPPTV